MIIQVRQEENMPKIWPIYVVENWKYFQLLFHPSASKVTNKFTEQERPYEKQV